MLRSYGPRAGSRLTRPTRPLMFLSPLGERLGEGVQCEDCLLHHPLTQPLPQGGEEHERPEKRMKRKEEAPC
jgi:hypothetical protein